jgi:hypothetical protein
MYINYPFKLVWFVQVLNSAVPRSTLLIASINMDKTDTKRQMRLRYCTLFSVYTVDNGADRLF